MEIQGVEVKPIPGYENLYLASFDGRIWSIRRNKWMKLSISGSDRQYLQVCLSKNNKTKYFGVHRLIASVWIPNPNNLPQVNHIDENPLNNCVDNLEWCTAQYNNNYGTRNKRETETRTGRPGKIKIKCIETGEEWDSITDCAKSTGFGYQNLKYCVSGKTPSCHGFHFEEVI